VDQLTPSKINGLFGFDATSMDVGFGALISRYGESCANWRRRAHPVSHTGGALINAVLNVPFTPVITFHSCATGTDHRALRSPPAGLGGAEIVSLGRRTDEAQLGAFLRGQLRS
jgi:hypothetical protein